MDADNKTKGHHLLSLDNGRSLTAVSFDAIQTVYIAEGLTPEQLSERFHMPLAQVNKFIEDNKLEELRKAHIKNGLSKLQNIQVQQAEKLMSLENDFKRMRIIQLESMLQDFMAYYSRHGHFSRVHPITQEILKDSNGLAIQIKVPDVVREITNLKESVALSEGLKNLLGQIDAIIHKPRDVENLNDEPGDIDMDKFFKKKPKDNDDE